MASGINFIIVIGTPSSPAAVVLLSLDFICLIAQTVVGYLYNERSILFLTSRYPSLCE